jgi:hypothetical protein
VSVCVSLVRSVVLQPTVHDSAAETTGSVSCCRVGCISFEWRPFFYTQFRT